MGGLYISGMIAFLVIAQIMFKYAGNHAFSQLDLLGAYASNPWLWTGLLSSGLGLMCWVMALRKMSLAFAYPWTALIYVFTPIASVLLFDEHFNERYIVGMFCIVIGVFLSAGGAKEK